MRNVEITDEIVLFFFPSQPIQLSGEALFQLSAVWTVIRV
jgi:hypothetical protein